MPWKRVPIRERLDIRIVWEHTPADYYRYGEYPRYINPPGWSQPQTEWKWVEEKEDE